MKGRLRGTYEAYLDLQKRDGSALYLVALAIFVAIAFITSTTARSLMIGDATIRSYFPLVGKCAACVALLYAVLFSGYKPWQLVCGAAVLAVMYLGSRHATVYQLLWMSVMVFAAHKVSFRRILWVYVAIVGIGSIVAYGLGTAGIIKLLDYTRDGITRHAFGSIYPTDFAAHMFYLGCALLCLRGERINLVDVGIELMLAVGVYVGCQARSAAYCLVLLGLVALYVFLWRFIRKKPYQLSRGGLILCCVAPCLCAGAMIWFSWHFDPTQPFMHELNEWLSGRLRMGRIGFDRYPITLLGQHIKMNGWGAGHVVSTQKYFFLDSWYIQGLLKFGVIGAGAALLMCPIASIRAYRASSYILPLVIVVIGIHCVTDQYLTNLSYDVFLLAASAMHVREGTGADEH